MIGVYDDGGVDRGDMREEGGAVDEGEAVVGEVDRAIVIAREELELGHDHGGGKEDLLGDLAAGDGCVGADARLDLVVAIPVRDHAVGDQDEVFSPLRDGRCPSFRLDVSLQTSYACRQLTKRLVDIIRGRDHEGQFIDVSLVRHPQVDGPLDTTKFEKWLQKVAFAGPVFSTRRLNMDRYFHFRRSFSRSQRAD